MKNELNAAIHFINFFQQNMNLAVADPNFYMTLQNLSMHHQTNSGTDLNAVIFALSLHTVFLV